MREAIELHAEVGPGGGPAPSWFVLCLPEHEFGFPLFLSISAHADRYFYLFCAGQTGSEDVFGRHRRNSDSRDLFRMRSSGKAGLVVVGPGRG